MESERSGKKDASKELKITLRLDNGPNLTNEIPVRVAIGTSSGTQG